jgi:hypothetical protein
MLIHLDSPSFLRGLFVACSGSCAVCVLKILVHCVLLREVCPSVILCNSCVFGDIIVDSSRLLAC